MVDDVGVLKWHIPARRLSIWNTHCRVSMNVSSVSAISVVDEYLIAKIDEGRKARRVWLGFTMLVAASVGVFIALQ
jgi:hypothetical protein